MHCRPTGMCSVLCCFLFFLFFSQFFHALHVIFVANDSFVFDLDNDDIFEADGVDLTWSVVVDEDVRATQFGMLAKGAYSLLVSGKS